MLLIEVMFYCSKELEMSAVEDFDNFTAPQWMKLGHTANTISK